MAVPKGRRAADFPDWTTASPPSSSRLARSDRATCRRQLFSVNPVPIPHCAITQTVASLRDGEGEEALPGGGGSTDAYVGCRLVETGPALPRPRLSVITHGEGWAGNHFGNLRNGPLERSQRPALSRWPHAAVAGHGASPCRCGRASPVALTARRATCPRRDSWLVLPTGLDRHVEITSGFVKA